MIIEAKKTAVLLDNFMSNTGNRWPTESVFRYLEAVAKGIGGSGYLEKACLINEFYGININAGYGVGTLHKIINSGLTVNDCSLPSMVFMATLARDKVRAGAFFSNPGAHPVIYFETSRQMLKYSFEPYTTEPHINQVDNRFLSIFFQRREMFWDYREAALHGDIAKMMYQVKESESLTLPEKAQLLKELKTEYANFFPSRHGPNITLD